MLDENPAEADSTAADQPTDPAATSQTAGPGSAPPDSAPEAAKKAAGTKAAAKKSAAKKSAAKKATTRKAVAKKATKATEPAPPGDTPTAESDDQPVAELPAKKTAAKKATAKKATAKKATAKKATAKKATAKKATAKKAATGAGEAPATDGTSPTGQTEPRTDEDAATAAALADALATPEESSDGEAEAAGSAAVLFQPPKPVRSSRRKKSEQPAEEPAPAEIAKSSDAAAEESPAASSPSPGPDGSDEDGEQGSSGRRRRRRGGRRRRKGGADEGEAGTESADGSQDDADKEKSGAAQGKSGQSKSGEGKSGQGKGGQAKSGQGKGGQGKSGKGGDDKGGDADGSEGQGESSSSRRRRRRRRAGEEGDGSGDDPQNTVTKVRKGRSPEDEITALTGSTRLEAKKQRRREGREAGRRRAPIVSEAEFLARREAVDRVMVIRQRKDLTQIAVLEDKVLVEHYVARESQTSLIGNVYLGRVQNVLPSMEAAFIDIGKGRNAVLYAGEVNWDALGAGNGPRKIEQVLKSGQSVLVQVTKDPVGHKGARLTSQISLPGRFLVYVPDGNTSGISRKLPDTERNRLKSLLKEIVPESAGVIVRTAAEGASEEELTRDVERLTARWQDISAKVEKGNAPQLLYGEPDLTLKVVRDLFTEDFRKLVVSGDDAWDMVQAYVEHVAPDLAERLERYAEDDVFAAYRIDEQIAKALDRKVWLPSGGSLIIDRTEAMTVVDVNTGKFTGSGGNLEETVTKNNLEAAEEIVRQLRLRDIGGIIVVDFIDMVLESNRDLVLRRLVECLGRDRTRHQVAEVTSLGLVQMTRKRIGTGLLEAFSESCEHCQGRGLVVHHEPIEPKKRPEEDSRRSRRGRGRGKSEDSGSGSSAPPSPKDVAAMARHEGGGEATPAEEPGQQEKAEPAKEEPKKAAQQADTSAEPARKPAEQGQQAQQSAAESAGKSADQTQRPAKEQSEQSEQSEQPAAGSPSPDGGAPAVAEPAPQPEPPRVVTSSRRRIARRPAGPPQAAGADAGAPSADGTGPSGDGAAPAADGAAPAGASGSGTEEPATAHVPVKKKGSRRR